MNTIFNKKLSNNYIYSSHINTPLFIPSAFIKYINKEFDENKDKLSYYQKKYMYWKEYGVFDKEPFSIDIEYDSSYIDSNLANLRQLLIEVTDGCNLSCKYCGYGELYGNYDKRVGKKQSFPNVKILIDYLFNLWNSDKNISFDNTIYIGFYGGEPLMNFTLIRQVIDYIDKLTIPGLKFEYNMTTNGVLLSKYMDYIVEKKFHLLISLDGNKENNNYRVTKTGEESFDIVLSNIENLMQKHPEYFNSFVNFNTVLHNHNSIKSSYEYIKNTFDKTPTISELSFNGILQERINEFLLMFSAKSESYFQYSICNNNTDDMLYIDPKTMQLSNFFEAYTGNTFRTIPDLFFTQQNQRYLPTSTCPPFYKKFFLTVNGKILPCEKIGQNYPLGYIKDNEIHIDSNEIKAIYAGLYQDIIEQCKNCYLWKNCGNCIYFFDRNDKGQIYCSRYFGINEVDNYYSEIFSILEDNPELYEKIVTKIQID